MYHQKGNAEHFSLCEEPDPWVDKAKAYFENRNKICINETADSCACDDKEISACYENSLVRFEELINTRAPDLRAFGVKLLEAQNFKDVECFQDQILPSLLRDWQELTGVIAEEYACDLGKALSR